MENRGHEFLGKILVAFRWVKVLTLVTLLIPSIIIWMEYHPAGLSAASTERTITMVNLVENGIDLETGLIAKDDYVLVKNTCTSCHSSNQILRSKLSRQTWIDKIRWMQATQKLWDLGANEKTILDYLEKYYGPDSTHITFRKPPLKNIVWYRLR